MSILQSLESIIRFWFQLCVIFPYSVLTIPRHRRLLQANPNGANAKSEKERIMISEKVYELCTGGLSVSSLLAKDLSLSPSDAWKKLYAHDIAAEKESVSTARANRDEITPEDLKRARECGKWGPTAPSELFLRIYHDALCTIDRSVSGCMVSPSLMGSYGVIPLTVISVVPDIMRHMSNLIVRAEKEVILATNYWQNSVASKFVTNAMRELSKRAGERGQRIAFKLQYDRGAVKQVVGNHYVVSQKEYMGKAVALPAPEDIPYIDLEVMNYHRPMLGTFHCKYMVVDRNIAVLQSNNIQDNDNMEMMTHLEGPIVDSLYDMALLSWSKKFESPLPSHNSSATDGVNDQDQSESSDKISEARATIRVDVLPQSGKVHQNTVTGAPEVKQFVGPSTNNSILHPDDGKPLESRQKEQSPVKGNEQDFNEHDGKPKNLGHIEMLQENARALAISGDAEHVAKTQEQDEKDQSLGHPVQRATNALSGGQINGDSTNGASNSQGASPDAKPVEFFATGHLDISQSQIIHPIPADSPLPEHTTDGPHYDVDIAGEVARVQTAVSPQKGESRVQAVTRHLNHTTNVDFQGNSPECKEGDEMIPFIPHAVSTPFPIALVNREPYGTPNHHSVYNPQNEAWLSALRNAKKNVFIQSPTLNAEPLVPAIIEACERGIDVFCYICLGYNDTGELLPMQGGTNEMIAHTLYSSISPAAKGRLHYFWYVAKDQIFPIVAKQKKRACHIKLMIVDERIGIQGNGNMDTQSWFHSQEANVLIESESVCRAWIEGLRRNQNTLLYGSLRKEEGLWKDVDGKEALGVIGVDPGRFSWLKGMVGAVERVRGTGGF